MSSPQKILFVCLGNICRSPSAEIILRQKLKAAGQVQCHIDSSGTAAYHVGSRPNQRMLHALERAHYAYDGHRARQFSARDFQDFDLIIPQDESNREDILALARCEEDRAKVIPMSHWFTGSYRERYSEVPDPYYGGDSGFDAVVQLLESSCDQMIIELFGEKPA